MQTSFCETSAGSSPTGWTRSTRSLDVWAAGYGQSPCVTSTVSAIAVRSSSITSRGVDAACTLRSSLGMTTEPPCRHYTPLRTTRTRCTRTVATRPLGPRPRTRSGMLWQSNWFYPRSMAGCRMRTRCRARTSPSGWPTTSRRRSWESLRRCMPVVGCSARWRWITSVTAYRTSRWCTSSANTPVSSR